MSNYNAAVNMIIDVETGEVIDSIGGVFIDEKQLEAARKRKEYLEKLNEIEKYKNAGHNNFIWILFHANQSLDLGITQSELTELIFISTYISYDNKIMMSQREPMSKMEMMKIMKLSKMKFFNFYNSMISNNIFIEKTSDSGKKEIFVNDKIFNKGKLTVEHIPYEKTKLYKNGIQYIYNNSTSREHKLLSYLFQAIPYTNLKYNIICNDIFETEMENINAMSLTEYADIIGYSQENITRLKRDLLHVMVDDKYAFTIHLNGSSNILSINPNIYYAYDDNDAKNIVDLFTPKDKK